MHKQFTKLQMKVLRELTQRDESYGSVLAYHLYKGEPATTAGCELITASFDFDIIANYFYKVLVLPSCTSALVAIDTRFHSDKDIEGFQNLIRFYND